MGSPYKQLSTLTAVSVAEKQNSAKSTLTATKQIIIVMGGREFPVLRGDLAVLRQYTPFELVYAALDEYTTCEGGKGATIKTS